MKVRRIDGHCRSRYEVALSSCFAQVGKVRPAPESKPMRRLPVLLLAALAGCQLAPAVPAPAAVKPPPTIRLFGEEVPAEAMAVQAAVLRHIPPGLPATTASARLAAAGFTCPDAEMLDPKPAGPDGWKAGRLDRLVCSIGRHEAGDWGGLYFNVEVTIPCGEDGLVKAAEVPRLWRERNRCTAFFARHPELKQPVGLPLEQARAALQAQGFCCDEIRPGGGSRPYLACRFYEENPVGGTIIRVHLVGDESGTVRDVEVVQQPGRFDDLLCLLPNEGDTLGAVVLKGMVFPLRLYAALVVGGLAAYAR
jgi:hypothetical protein